MKIILASIFMFLAIKGHSQEKIVWSKSDSIWAWVGQVDGSVFLIKKTYETKSNGETTIWVKTFNNPTKVKGKVVKKGTVEKTLYVFDCPNKKMKAIQRVTYDSDGKLLKSVTIEDYEQKWTNIVPETVGEELSRKACELE